MPSFQSILDLPLFSNTPIAWLIACTVAGGVFVLMLAARRVVRAYNKKLKATERTEFLEIPVKVLSHTALPFFVVVSMFAGLQTLTMAANTSRLLISAITIALFWQAGIWAGATASAWLERKRRRTMAGRRPWHRWHRGGTGLAEHPW
jgi:TRAP-type C4-dicarboxylate transport system permease large subunit